MFSIFKSLVMCLVFAATGVDPLLAADSLRVSPANPTTSDSIELGIVIRSWTCCSHFLCDPNAVALSNDSTIVISYRDSEPPVCSDTFCVPRPIPILTYKRGPLPAGRYSVYAQSLPQVCTAQNCPQLVPALPALIGRFTVTQASAVLFRNKSIPLEEIGRASGYTRVYNIRGDIVSTSPSGASKRAPGVYFIKPEGRSSPFPSIQLLRNHSGTGAP